ncbi:MAG TPA: AAA family ATPase [Thermomicrobiales bacterium]|nr:AAA family ATPase [Thermomicrobiales bacterium]
MADPPPPAARHGSSPPLVGRAREQAALRDHLAAALAGRGSLVLVGGEAGIGKTALCEVVCAEAITRGARVAAGRCYDLSETPPYGPWREALAALSGKPGLPPLPDALAGMSGGEGIAGQEALHVQVRAFLAASSAERPLVLLLDDLHWADPASLDLLRSIGRRLGALPLVLLVTYRTDELSRWHPLFQLLPALVRESAATRLDLRPLEPDDLRALIRAEYRLPEPEEAQLAGYLDERAQGNPFFAREILHALVDERLLRPDGGGWRLGDLARAQVPPLLRQVIERRLARLGEAARDLLALAAVIGQEMPLDLWAAASGVPEEALSDAAERAVEAHLLAETPDGAGLRFVHALLRETLYVGLALPRRRAWHRRLGELLAARPAPDPDAVAYHFRLAGDPRAVEWLIKAGRRAQLAFAWTTATDRFEAARALMEQRGTNPVEKGAWLFLLAQLYRYADPQRSLAYADEVAQLARETGDRVLALCGLAVTAWHHCESGDLRWGVAEMTAYMATVDSFTPEEAARNHALLVTIGLVPDEHNWRGVVAHWLRRAGRYAEASALCAPAAERQAAQPPAIGGIVQPSYGEADFAMAEVQARLGRPEEARRAYARAREAYGVLRDYLSIGGTALDELWCVLWYQPDRLAERRALADEAERAYARARGAIPPTFRLPARGRLPLLALEGCWAEARAIGLAVRSPGPDSADLVRRVLGPLAREQGDRELGWRLVREGLPAGLATEPGDTDLDVTLVLQRVAAGLAADAGDLPTARAWLAAHDRFLAWSGAVPGRAEGQLAWADYHRAAGERILARRHAERALADARDPRRPLMLLAAHRLLGELATEAGRHAEAAAHLTDGLALADACAAPYERALTLLAQAELRAATGDRTGARELLDEMRAICAPLGAQPALARADALAARLAGDATAANGYPAGLSAREVEVLRLVARGLTDVQVAERLFVSRRTVGTHLGSIYNKLGVSSRAAATRFAVEHGLA